MQVKSWSSIDCGQSQGYFPRTEREREMEDKNGFSWLQSTVCFLRPMDWCGRCSHRRSIRVKEMNRKRHVRVCLFNVSSRYLYISTCVHSVDESCGNADATALIHYLYLRRCEIVNALGIRVGPVRWWPFIRVLSNFNIYFRYPFCILNRIHTSTWTSPVLARAYKWPGPFSKVSVF